MTRRTFVLLSAVIVLAALLIREWMALAAVVPSPMQGDVSGYLRYALHLLRDGVFTQALEGQPVVPDAFRSPGYPWLLALLLPAGDNWQDGFARVYQAQALLGAATVACTIALARQWMPRGWALVAGVWMAVQTHHVAATVAMLTEVLFGFLIVAGLLCASLSLRRRDMRLALLAGAAMAYGYLVNPVMAFLPFLLLPLFWREKLTREGVAMTLVVVLAIGGWSARNAVTGARGDARAVINFVQGSWPEYHDLWKWGWRWPAKEKAYGAEMTAAQKDMQATLPVIRERMAQDPWRYVRWYAWEKPRLLWDWEIRVGHGMAYTVSTYKAPLDHGVLLATTTIQWALNKAAFWIALGGILLALRRREALPVAIAAVYFTAVHTVFQAEPRYAIPYRSLEIMLAVGALAWAWSLVPKSAPYPNALNPVGGE